MDEYGMMEIQIDGLKDQATAIRIGRTISNMFYPATPQTSMWRTETGEYTLLSRTVGSWRADGSDMEHIIDEILKKHGDEIPEGNSCICLYDLENPQYTKDF